LLVYLPFALAPAYTAVGFRSLLGEGVRHKIELGMKLVSAPHSWKRFGHLTCHICLSDTVADTPASSWLSVAYWGLCVSLAPRYQV
jgi:hypothetical protein